MAITSTHQLLTDSWTTQVEALETAIGQFRAGGARSTNDCQVVFFEIARDLNLHVNITHKYQTRTVPGWAGPASLPTGFVHNRTFAEVTPSQIVRHLRKMVFAARIG